MRRIAVQVGMTLLGALCGFGGARFAVANRAGPDGVALAQGSARPETSDPARSSAAGTPDAGARAAGDGAPAKR
jgi:hypothetical protein